MAGSGRRAAKVALALAPVLLLLGALELRCRSVEGSQWWQRVEEEQTGADHLKYEKNVSGLRDENYPSPRPFGRYRILFLGDSFTYGRGVARREATFPELLEARLNADKPDPAIEKYEVLNGAVSGTLTDAWVKIVEGPGALFMPQLVVGVFFLRDGTRLGLTRNFFGPVRDAMEKWRDEDPLARWSAAWRLWQGRRRALAMTRDYIDEFHRSYFGSATETAEWRAAQERLIGINDRIHRSRARFELVVFPVLFELGRDYPFQAICDEVLSFGRAQAIPTLSLLPALSEEPAERLWVSPYDQHPNELCHRLVADALETWLRPQLAPVIPEAGR